MKFYVRRAVIGIISIPFVAGAWCFVYLAFILLGGEPNQSVAQTFDNGLLVGIVLALFLTFAPQVSRLISFLAGEK